VNNELEIDENGYFDLANCRCWQRREIGIVTLSHAPYNNSARMQVQEAGKLQRKIIYCIVEICSNSRLN
jgi:hypothetical protein